MLVNGTKLDIFNDHILPKIKEEIQNHHDSLDTLNLKVQNSINKIHINNQQCHANIGSSKTDDSAKCEVQCITYHESIDKSVLPNKEYACPICLNAARLDTIIACEECNEWFHFSCTGITRADVNKLHENLPYICMSCVDNQLYNSNASGNSQAEEFGPEPIVISPETNLKLPQNNTKHERSKITDFSSKPESDSPLERALPSYTGDSTSDVTNHETKLKLPLNNVNQEESIYYTGESISENQQSQPLEFKMEPSNSESPKAKPPKNHQSNTTEQVGPIQKPIEVDQEIIYIHTEDNLAKSNKTSKETKFTKRIMGNDQKLKSSMIDNLQRSYILELERKVQDRDKTIQIMEARLSQLEQSHQSTSNTSQTNSNFCNCHQLYNRINTNSHNNNYYSCQLQNVMNNVKALEQQLTQHMCINTDLTTQTAIQQQQSMFVRQTLSNVGGYAAQPNMNRTDTQNQHFIQINPHINQELQGHRFMSYEWYIFK
ncbi:unnamed protein product [Mytilus coruscus]|uniref:PHD-type domain-containing protein n=1 Tax=Mytilus coruscus TaxID=42192 RepID=A0A6J8CZF5_MYTCO|nr:unnamed protein product [Mytilus coruscus]